MSLQSFIKSKELGLYDFGCVSVVYPTGRFIEVYSDPLPDYYEKRHRYMIEVRLSKILGSKKWVSLNNLKEIRNAHHEH
jgi:hypothetical protein